MNRGGVQTAPGDGPELLLICGDAAAAAAQGIGRTDNDRIADILRGPERRVQRFRDLGRNAGLADGLHGIAEFFPVLRFFNGVDGGAQQADAVLIQRAVPAQLHGQGESGLAAQTGQQTVRPFLFNDPAQGDLIQGLQIDFIRQMLIRHDGGGIGIDQNHIDPFRFQHAAGLSAGIIKFRRLTDHDGTGTDDQGFAD